MNLRVLSIRKHKKVTFLNAYSDEHGISQFMIINELFQNIKCGDLINVDCVDTTNNRGDKLKQIININYVIPSYDFESYKGINSEIDNTKQKDYIEARNCGKQLIILQFKQELLKNIKNILDKKGFFDATTLLNTVEHYKNGSNIVDAEILDRDENDPKYLRITLENQLKQMVGMMLKSCYGIDKVYRNMGEDNGHINEFLMMEFVSINLSIQEIINFVLQIDSLSSDISKEYELTTQTEPIEIIDFNDLLKKNTAIEEIKNKLNNFLVLNYPCESPFIKKDEFGLSTETRWYMNGHWISHFYEDENNFEVIQKSLELQSSQTLKTDTNPLDYFKWGLPNTTSFGLSIDRWLQLLLNKESISSIANPLQLDYMKRELKK